MEKRKNRGFIITSIIYLVILAIAIALILLFWFDGRNEWGVLGHYDEHHGWYTSPFPIFTVPPTVFLLELSIFALLPVLILISLILVSSSSKKGKTKKRHFVPAIIAGAIASNFLVGIPLLVFAIMGIGGVNKETKDLPELGAIPETMEKAEEMEAVFDVDEQAPAFIVKSEEEVKTDEKPRNGKVAFIIVSAIYALFLVLGILSFFGINTLWDDPALNEVTGGLTFAWVGCYFLYFFTLSPFIKDEKVKKIGMGVSIGAIFVANVFPILMLIKNRGDLQANTTSSMFGLPANVLMIMVMVISELGLIITTLLTQWRLNPEKIKKKETVKDEKGDSVLTMILKTIIQIIIGIINSAMALMRLKEKNINVYSVLVTVIFTFLSFVLTEVMAVLFLLMVFGIIIFVFGKFIEFSYIPTSYNVAVIMDENGREIIVKQASGSQSDIYEDDMGRRFKRVSSDHFVYAEP